MVILALYDTCYIGFIINNIFLILIRDGILLMTPVSSRNMFNIYGLHN